MEPIQLFVPTFRIEETLDEIRVCLEKGWTGLGYKTIEFEEAWRRFTGLPHAHFLSSATAGLHLAVAMLKYEGKWQDGDEIITTPMTFVSTNHAILYERLKPVFADIDDTLCLDPASIESRITPKTRAVIFVGLGGNTGKLAEVVKLCRKHKLRLILDAAHMTGTRWKDGTHIGGETDVSVFSFQAVKNLPTADSGMICFADERLDIEARKWTWMGINKDTYARTASQGSYKWYYDVEYEGFKYNGNSIMAAMGLVAIKYVDSDNAYRRQIASWYDSMLADESRIKRIAMSADCEPSRHLYQVEVEHRDEVMLALNQANIFPGVHYRDNTLYPMYKSEFGKCPRAHLANERVISLPIHMRLTHEQVVYIAKNLKEIVGYLSRPKE
ncbi:MAG TPA: aminotransferase DegT [Anaerolineaceae bacterium]|nr:aminotransferase DegT [Anaerolineaceae bacterium]